MVSADAPRALLEPLIEACRPRRKARRHDRRCTIEAILWRCQDGAKRRAIPAELGPLGSRGRGCRLQDG